MMPWNARQPDGIFFIMKKPQCYVYQYTDPRPESFGTPIYIGKGSRKRCNDHLTDAKNPLLKRVLDKIRSEGLAPIVKIVARFDTEAEAFEVEKALIAFYGRRDIGTGSLCNLTPGGEGSAGYRFTAGQRERLSQTIKERYATGWTPGPNMLRRTKETNSGRTFSLDHRQKLAEAKIGKKLSPDHVKKLSEAHKGRVMPQETRGKIADALKGHVISDETRKKIGAANRGKVWTEEQKARLAESQRRRRQREKESRT